ncbi:MAG: cytoplasmic protein [Nocardioidaceae bacterium]|nr:cytoplasmic protein [Nocardioidaceae bacterium]
MTTNRGRALLAGETWLSYGIHQKGFSAYTTGGYEVGSDEFVAALRAKGWEVDHIPNHLATETFPATVAALKEYDVVILSDIGADTLLLHPDTFVRGERTPNRLTVIDEWVRSGGGFLMIGGYMSFAGFEAKGRYHATAVEACLPVQIRGYDDRAERPEGVHPRVEIADHQILSGLTEPWPYFLGYNRLIAKSEASVLLAVEGDPFLAVWPRGDGRSAAFASDCSPHWGSPDFMAWDGYAAFWDQLLSWLARSPT